MSSRSRGRKAHRHWELQKRPVFFPLDDVYQTDCVCVLQGLCIAIPGPTLLDLKARTHTDIEHISRIFTGRSVGYLGGSVLGGEWCFFPQLQLHPSFTQDVMQLVT